MPKGVFTRTKPVWNKGKKRPPFSLEWRKKLGLANLGSHRTQETRRKMSGENHPNWKGGITSEYQRIRNSIEYRLWREAVYKRDNFTCQKCKDNKGGNLTPHHILNFETHMDLRLAIDNGITLCNPCHIKFHKRFGYKGNNGQQLEEFLKEVM